MAIITDLFGAFLRRPYPQGNPALAQAGPNYDTLSSGSTRAGVTITDDSATTITAVYRAVQLVASNIAAMPLDVIEKQDDGSRVTVEYDEDRYLWDRPNREVPAIVFWETAIGHEVLNGNSFMFVTKNGDQGPLELWPLEPGRVQPVRDRDGFKWYILDGDTDAPRFDYSRIRGKQRGEIVHVPGWGYNGLVGISPIKKQSAALGLAKAAEEYASLMFGQGSTPGGLLYTDQDITEVDAKTYSALWESAHGGVARSHRTAVMGRGLKWQSVSINPEDAQMLATRQFQVSEIARMFGIPEVMLNAHDKTSSWGTGVEALMQQFRVSSLQPHIIRFEQTISDELLNKSVTKRYVKFNVNGALRGTPAERAAWYERMQRMGIYTINEIRAFEDMSGIGPQGDVRLIPLNIGQLDNLSEDLQVPNDPEEDDEEAPPA